MTYSPLYHFIETPTFTKLARAFLDDAGHRAFQLSLMLRPELGAVIPGTGGLRKARWAAAGRGKRGGLRIIYYWDAARATFYCLYLYMKNEQDDLTPVQCRILRRIVEEELE